MILLSNADKPSTKRKGRMMTGYRDQTEEAKRELEQDQDYQKAKKRVKTEQQEKRELADFLKRHPH